MLLAKLIKSNIRADITVQDEFNPALFKALCTALNNLFIKFEIRDAVNQEAACTVMTVINSDLPAKFT